MAVYLIESKADQQRLIDYVGEDIAKLFFTLKDRLKSPENDIYYWLKRSPEELENRLNSLQSTKTRSQKDEEASEGAELLYNQDGWKVYHITTYEASAKYGKNTQWCIAGSKRWSNGERGEEYFNDYTRRGAEFYFYIKSNDEKYALAYTPQNNRYQVFDQVDNDITDEDLSFLPNVDRLPRFNLDDLLSEDGTFTYEGGEVPDKLKDKIKRVEVSDSVTRIGVWAFDGCASLISITIPDSVTGIGSGAFEGCFSLTSITIPDSVTSIGDSAFDNCSSLTNMVIPDSVTNIGNNAFYGCDSLKSVTIHDSVTSIGYAAFRYCSSLTSITIPDSVTSIGYGTFWGCTRLKSVTIPDSVADIGNGAFLGCVNLTVYTDNEYAIGYCEENDIPHELLSEFPG